MCIEKEMMYLATWSGDKEESQLRDMEIFLSVVHYLSL